MLKLLGVLLLSSVPAIIGFLLCGNLKTREEKLSLMCFLIDELQNGITFRKEDIFLMFDDLSDSKRYKELSLLSSLSGIHDKFNMKSIKAIVDRENDFNSDDKRIASEFFSGLGTSDSKSQDKHCEAYKEIFERRKSEAGHEYAEKARLYRSLGMFVSAFVAILLI